jgi:hypothetical protein
MLVGPMSVDQVRTLLAEAPGLRRASHIDPPKIPVLEAFETVIPGLRPGTTLSITGSGATSLALALVARASQDKWIASVDMPALGLVAASEFGLALDHLVVVPEPQKQWIDTMAAVVDAFDVVLAHSPPHREARKLTARVRERDAVFVVVGATNESDLQIAGTNPTWHGIGDGHGYLAARTIDLTVTGRGGAARARRATLWLPDPDGTVSLAQETVVRKIRAG